MFKIFMKYFSYLMTIVVSIALVWGSVSWAKYNDKFNNPNIVISGNSIVEDNEYMSALLKEIGNDLFAEDISTIAKFIEEHPYVAGARVSKHFPRGILVEVCERYPIAILNSNPIMLIDNNCTVLPLRSNSFDLKIPILSNFKITEELFPIGKKTQSSNAIELVTFLIKLQREYPKLYQNLSEIRLSIYNDFELILEDQPTKIVIGQSIDWSKILVLKEFEKSIKGRKSLTDYLYLDLRYDNQVITKERQV